MVARVFPVSDWAFFFFRGEDAKAFLQGLVTADLAALSAGGWTPACVLTPKGLLAADCELYDRGSGVLALTRPAAAEGFARAFSTKIMLSRSTMERPRPRAHLLFDAETAAGLPWRDLGGPVRLLLDAEPPRDAAPMSREEFHARRAAAGLPWFGVDMDGSTLPLEARQEAAVSLTKGCFMGQETVSRQARRGRVTRRLARVRFAGAAPAPGAAVSAAGAEAGRITSSAGEWALAMLRAEAAVAGTAVESGSVRGAVVD